MKQSQCNTKANKFVSEKTGCFSATEVRFPVNVDNMSLTKSVTTNKPSSFIDMHPADSWVLNRKMILKYVAFVFHSPNLRDVPVGSGSRCWHRLCPQTIINTTTNGCSACLLVWTPNIPTVIDQLMDIVEYLATKELEIGGGDQKWS